MSKRENAISLVKDNNNREHSLLINDSGVENASINEDALDKDTFYVYSDLYEVTDRILPHTLLDFLVTKMTDIQVPLAVQCNEAIGELAIKYETDESEADEVSSLEIVFNRVARWFGREYSFAEYYRDLNNSVELSKRAGVEIGDTEG